MICVGGLRDGGQFDANEYVQVFRPNKSGRRLVFVFGVCP